MKEDRINNKKINYSYELLRLLLCFWVVAHHCCRKVNKFKGRFHVPTFMIMSFYFYYNNIKLKNIIKIKQRYQRLLIPYIIWAIFIFILNNILFKLFGFSLTIKKKLLIKDLVLQLIFGAHYHLIFYYQFNLIFITTLFNIISFLFNSNLIFLLQILLFVSYIFQYSYWNFYIFTKYSFIRFSLGSIFEFLPFAIAGASFSCLDLVTILKKYKVLVILYIGAIIFLILKFNIFVRISGFWYPGIFLNVGGICIFILFSLFSFQNRIFIFLLKIISKFTGGIYYIHITYFAYLSKKFFFIKNKTFHGSIFIYLKLMNRTLSIAPNKFKCII